MKATILWITLVHHGTLVYASSSKDGELLVAAALAGRLDLVRQLVEEKSLIDYRNAYGATALSSASAKGYIEIVELLLEKDADLDSADNYGWTPLMYAAQGHPDVVRRLINASANVKAKNLVGWDAFSIALYHNHVDRNQKVVALFSLLKAAPGVAQVEKRRPLFAAAVGFSTEKISFYPGNPFPGSRYSLPETIAAINDVNVQDPEGNAALHYTCVSDKAEHAAVLFDNRASLQIRNQYGYTPFHLAAENGAVACMMQFLKRDVDVDSTITKTGDTALMLASFKGHRQVVQLLLSSSAAVNVQSKSGDSALTYSCMIGDHVIAQLLLTKGAKQLKNRAGLGPLDYALKSGNQQLIDLLRHRPTMKEKLR